MGSRLRRRRSNKTVFLHIGTPKSGTTYLQAVCQTNRDRLADAGVLWPGRDLDDQALAVHDLVNARPQGRVEDTAAGAWKRLLGEVRQWDGDSVLISHEWMMAAGPLEIDRAVETLAPAQVHVIITVRDLVRTVPAQWQESVQNGDAWSWEEFLAAAVAATDDDGGGAHRYLWEQQDVGAALASWGRRVPPEAMHVVTVPPAGAHPHLLWRRFAQVLGVEPDGCALPEARNTSLGSVSAELMRRISGVWRERQIPWPAYWDTLRDGLAKEVLSRRRGEPPLALPARVLPWAAGQAARIVEDIESSGAHVVGDLSDLLPRPSTGAGEGASEITDDHLLEAAVDGFVGMAFLDFERLCAARDEAEAARRERDAAVARLDALAQEMRAYRDASPSVRRLIEMSWRVRWLGALAAGLRRVRGLRRP